MNEKDYKYAITIASCKSFSQAAEFLYVSQPALSRYISNLEKELGVLLFDRTSSPIQLTKAGTIFCSYAKTMLELEGNLKSDLRQHSLAQSKPIKVGVPLLTGEYILSRILPRILAKYPHIQIDPIQDLAENLCQRIASHQIDAAFICRPLSETDIVSELLLHEKVFLVGNRQHPSLSNENLENISLRNPLRKKLSSLQGVALIHCKPIAIISYMTEEALHKAGFHTTNEIKASSLPLALDLAAQGIGFTGVMNCQLKYGNPSTITMLCPIPILDCMLPFYLAYDPTKRQNTPELDIFIKEVISEYQQLPEL